MQRISRWFVPLGISLVVLTVVLTVGGPSKRVSADSGDAEIRQSLADFSELLATVESHYATDVDAREVLFNGAIPRMLRMLDPHSSFFNPEAYKQLRDDQKGSYAGVGMHIGDRGGSTIVVAPMPRTPAYRAGLRPGDVIVEVDGKNVEDLSVLEVSQRLRGQVSTDVRIGIERRG